RLALALAHCGRFDDQKTSADSHAQCSLKKRVLSARSAAMLRSYSAGVTMRPRYSFMVIGPVVALVARLSLIFASVLKARSAPLSVSMPKPTLPPGSAMLPRLAPSHCELSANWID